LLEQFEIVASTLNERTQAATSRSETGFGRRNRGLEGVVRGSTRRSGPGSSSARIAEDLVGGGCGG